MKKNRHIILIAFVISLISCSKVEDQIQTEEGSFVYSESVTVYTDNKLSSVDLILSSDDESLINEIKDCIKLNDHIDLEDFKSHKLSAEQNADFTKSLDNYVQIRSELNIEIVEINSETGVIEIELINPSKLKAVLPYLYTFGYEAVESVSPYAAIRYKYNSSDVTGIFVEPRHKETWLSGWGYKEEYNEHLHEYFEHNELVQSPWNDNDPTYKHGFRVTSNLSSAAANHSWISSSTPIY